MEYNCRLYLSRKDDLSLIRPDDTADVARRRKPGCPAALAAVIGPMIEQIVESF